MFILNSFSEFHVRLLEQSIISYLKPEINDLGVAVSYTFPAINIEDFNPKIWEKSHGISVFDREGKLFNQPSFILILQIKIKLLIYLKIN
jgi:hypothetical protein